MEFVGLDSAVGIATRYGLDGPGFESQWGWGEIFYTRSHQSRGPSSLLYNGYEVLYLTVKRPRRVADHRPPLGPGSVWVKLYICPPPTSVPAWHVTTQLYLELWKFMEKQTF